MTDAQRFLEASDSFSRLHANRHLGSALLHSAYWEEAISHLNQLRVALDMTKKFTERQYSELTSHENLSLTHSIATIAHHNMTEGMTEDNLRKIGNAFNACARILQCAGTYTQRQQYAVANLAKAAPQRVVMTTEREGKQVQKLRLGPVLSTEARPFVEAAEYFQRLSRVPDPLLLDEETMIHLPYLKIALEMTSHLSESEYENLTGRKAFETTHSMANIIKDAIVRDIVEKRFAHVARSPLEQCYRVIYAAVKMMEMQGSTSSVK